MKPWNERSGRICARAGRPADQSLAGAQWCGAPKQLLAGFRPRLIFAITRCKIDAAQILEVQAGSREPAWPIAALQGKSRKATRSRRTRRAAPAMRPPLPVHGVTPAKYGVSPETRTGTRVELAIDATAIHAGSTLPRRRWRPQRWRRCKELAAWRVLSLVCHYNPKRAQIARVSNVAKQPPPPGGG